MEPPRPPTPEGARLESGAEGHGGGGRTTPRTVSVMTAAKEA